MKLRVNGRFLAAGMVALSQSLSSSHAQGLFGGAPATDNELFAGYCVAVEESSAAWIASKQAQDQTPVPGVPPSDWQPASRFTQQQRERYAAYLAARGLLPPVNRLDAFMGIRKAQARGQACAKQCYAEIDECGDGSGPNLSPNWRKPTTDAEIKQTLEAWDLWHEAQTRCYAAPHPSCDRIGRCNELSAMPF